MRFARSVVRFFAAGVFVLMGCESGGSPVTPVFPPGTPQVPPPPGTGGGTGQPILALDNANRLITFSSSNPAVVTDTLQVSGLFPGETILGIDIRPADAQLYAITSQSNLYIVNQATGGATLVNTLLSLTPPVSSTTVGFDVDPTADVFRVLGSDGQNLRINPATLGVTADPTLTYLPGDAGAGVTPQVAAAAYTNSTSPPPSSTLLYAIDAGRGTLVTAPNPSDGKLQTVGTLGVTTTTNAGLDIAGVGGTAFAVLTAPGTTSSTLYLLNLATGKATSIGPVGFSSPLRGIAIP